MLLFLGMHLSFLVAEFSGVITGGRCWKMPIPTPHVCKAQCSGTLPQEEFTLAVLSLLTPDGAQLGLFCDRGYGHSRGHPSRNAALHCP